MGDLFLALFLLSIIGLIVGLTRPRWIKVRTRKEVLKFGLPALVVTFILAVTFLDTPDYQPQEALRAAEQHNELLQIELEETQQDLTQSTEKNHDQLAMIEALQTERDEYNQASEAVEEIVAELEQELQIKEVELNEKNEQITALKTEVKELEAAMQSLTASASTVNSSNQSQTATVSTSPTESEANTNSTAATDGCAPGTVRINHASASELQKIYQIGPERAEQIISLRSTPFNSYSDMTRISGIGTKHSAAIENEDIICFD
ncbi:competence protein ComEA helix-hairpin-helix repeat region [Amphibacillus marinus]|uniref:Competence protein ComEA helix-hairpin-helix repeat region n=1 Tax=Amphibacillus marinus TaxID=872970 RepID=A0A1H8LDY2_9BACI|nr:helix-hairpin-helix domain-containing protein [Amphibacillus marinus]SEO03345.1 competence protein ComEA helix-hairpin-helix repeat region [Amphibacillus marinus]